MLRSLLVPATFVFAAVLIATINAEASTQVIASDQIFADETIVIEGNIRITEQSSVRMSNVTLLFGSESSLHSIIVEDGSSLELAGCRIVMENESHLFRFQVKNSSLEISFTDLRVSIINTPHPLIEAITSDVSLSSLNISQNQLVPDLKYRDTVLAMDSEIMIDSVNFNRLEFPVVLESSTARITNSTFNGSLDAIRIHDSIATISDIVVTAPVFRGIEIWRSDVSIVDSSFSDMPYRSPDAHMAGVYASNSSGKITGSHFSNLPIGISSVQNLLFYEPGNAENSWSLKEIDANKFFRVENNQFSSNGIGFRGTTGVVVDNEFMDNDVDIKSVGGQLYLENNNHVSTGSYQLLLEWVLKLGTEDDMGFEPIKFKVFDSSDEEIAKGDDWMGWLSTLGNEGFDKLDQCGCLLETGGIMANGSIQDNNPVKIEVSHPRLGRYVHSTDVSENRVIFIDEEDYSSPSNQASAVAYSVLFDTNRLYIVEGEVGCAGLEVENQGSASIDVDITFRHEGLSVNPDSVHHRDLESGEQRTTEICVVSEQGAGEYQLVADAVGRENSTQAGEVERSASMEVVVTASAEGSAVVLITGDGLLPASVEIVSGEEVVWVNTLNGSLQNVSREATDAAGWSSPPLAWGEQFRYSFNDTGAGRYGYSVDSSDGASWAGDVVVAEEADDDGGQTTALEFWLLPAALGMVATLRWTRFRKIT